MVYSAVLHASLKIFFQVMSLMISDIYDNYCKGDIDICRGVQVKAEVEVDVCEAERSRAEKLRIHRLKHLRKIFSGSEN